MNQLPDIIVLDFCEWLNQKINNSYSDSPQMFDVLMGKGNYRYQLKEYANEFLKERHNPISFFRICILLFLNSHEYKRAIEYCERCNFRDRYRYCCFINNYPRLDVYYLLNHCPTLEESFQLFLQKNYDQRLNRSDCQISAEDLSVYTRYVIMHGNSEDEIYKQPPLLELMTNTSLELSEELSFFNWLEHNMDSATDVRKMPSSVFEMMVDSYIKDCKKTELEKRKLLKSYHQTGWDVLLEKFQVLARLKSRNSKSFSKVIERYYSCYGRYKCIILPLSDPKSQKEYRSLINDFWEDLNICSSDLLDIYYSELDTGKSGFDIAQRINRLPRKFLYEVPCVIIWKQSIDKAESLSISDLDSSQIVELIRLIVKFIEDKKEFPEIILEAKKKVAELKNSKRPINNYYAPVIKGDGNIMGDNNALGTGNVIGDSNSLIGNTFQADNPEYFENLLTDINEALSAIATSQELNDDMKKQVVQIMEDAKTGVIEKSTAKQEKAKTEFGIMKVFLTKIAPNLINVLANIATIASFFGITTIH